MTDFVRPKPPVLLSIYELFERPVELVVPKWQRDYSWSADEQVQALLDDFTDFILSEESSYLLGSIITYPAQPNVHAIVDGQQRCVTLYTLLVACRDVFRNMLIRESHEIEKAEREKRELLFRLESLVMKSHPTDSGGVRARVHLEYGSGDEALISIAFGLPRPSGILSNTQNNILAAYDKCKDYLLEKNQTSETLSTYIRTILDGTFLVETNVGDHRQAVDIFFKMNVRGLDLEGADYLKNFLFQQLDSSEYDALSDKWAAMSKCLRGADGTNKKLKSPEFFLRNWAIVNNGEKMNGDKAVFEYWQKLLKSKAEMKTFMGSIESQAQTYSSIVSYRLLGTKTKNPDMEAAEFLKGSQFIPALMAGSHLDEYQYFSGIIGYRYLLYVLSSEPTSRFESLVPRWSNSISRFAASASPERIEKALSGLDGFQFDQDQMRELNLKLHALDGISDARKVRLILSLISENWDYGAVDFSEYLKKFTVKKRLGFELDMIMSLSELSETGIDANHPDYKKYRSMGNFTLVNGQLSHFSSKKARAKSALYSNDKNILTIGLSGLPCPPNFDYDLDALRENQDYSVDDWNLDTIETRTDTLVNEFLDTFPTCMIGDAS
jgi:hypothetical protein